LYFKAIHSTALKLPSTCQWTFFKAKFSQFNYLQTITVASPRRIQIAEHPYYKFWTLDTRYILKTHNINHYHSFLIISQRPGAGGASAAEHRIAAASASAATAVLVAIFVIGPARFGT
jgi:hypothetical protein